jgi:hypothetical protein
MCSQDVRSLVQIHLGKKHSLRSRVIFFFVSTFISKPHLWVSFAAHIWPIRPLIGAPLQPKSRPFFRGSLPHSWPPLLLVPQPRPVRNNPLQLDRREPAPRTPSFQPIHQELTRDLEIVNWKRKHSVPNVESLRYRVEREGDQGPLGCSAFLCMLQRSFQKFTPDAAALMTGRHKQLCKKPQVATGPTEGKAKDFTCISATHKPSGSSFKEND